MNDCLHWGGVQRVAFMVKEKRCGRRQRFRDARGPRFAQAPKDDQDMRPADVHWLKVITRPSTRFQQDLESIAFFFFKQHPTVCLVPYFTPTLRLQLSRACASRSQRTSPNLPHWPQFARRRRRFGRRRQRTDRRKVINGKTVS